MDVWSSRLIPMDDAPFGTRLSVVRYRVGAEDRGLGHFATGLLTSLARFDALLHLVVVVLGASVRALLEHASAQARQAVGINSLSRAISSAVVRQNS